MKTIRTIILLLVMTLFSSCQFNQSVNKDIITGAYSKGEGIGCDDVAIEINGDKANRNEFVFGEKVNLVFNNVTGLKKTDGKTYPALAMYILKNEKDTVLSNPNLLKSIASGTELSPLKLEANFLTALPNQNNEKYKVFIEISDAKGDGKFNYELPFTIKKNDFLDINGNGIDYSNIYLWNETLKQPVMDHNVSADHLFILILDGIQGLEVSNGKVFPIFSIDITDNSGKNILSNPNLLSGYEETGVDPKDLKSQLTAKITFSEGTITNPCELKAQLKDKNSSKELTITTELNIN